MDKLKNLTVLLLLFLLFVLQQVVSAPLALTDEERSYIATRGPVQAVSVDGSGPIQYTDSKGTIRGVAVGVMREIGNRTGLTFEYRLIKELAQLHEVYAEDNDIIFGIPDQYALPGYPLSSSFLQSQAILFVNKAIRLQDLENKRFAATYSSALPKGISEDQAIYYQSREEAIKAVDRGEADFGYGNAYSIAFYTLQYGFRDIYTIPQSKEERRYRFQFIKDDPLLISIMEKALASFTPQELQTITLEATSQVERIITPSMIMDLFGEQIFFISLFIIAILLGALTIIQKSRSTLDLERKKFRTIAEVSNEYLFEYDAHDKNLTLYEKFENLFPSPEALKVVRKELVSQLAAQDLTEKDAIVELEMHSGENRYFRISARKVSSPKRKNTPWMGKLQDITEEIEKQNRLKDLAQTDGLTGLLNAATTRLRIEDRLQDKKHSETDFCIIFDLDNFKAVNDTFGHLTGDKVLKTIGSILLQEGHFNPDIIGRVGGDEFCVYLVALTSEERALSYCNTLLESIRFKLRSEGVTISLGGSKVEEKDTFETLFARVDQALYQAKGKGKNRIELVGPEIRTGNDKATIRATRL